MTKTFKNKLVPAAITAAALVLLVGCSDNTTETLPPPAITEPSPRPTTEATNTTTTTVAPPTTTTSTDTGATPDETTTTTTFFGVGDPVSLGGDTTTTTEPPPTTTTETPPTTTSTPPTTTTTTTPPTTTTTTTAPPAPKTDADFRAIAAAGGIPWDENSPNGIHVSYFWPDGFPDPEPYMPADSELPEDYHLYEYSDGIGGRHKVPEGLNFTCDSKSGWGRTIREEWELTLAGSHNKYKEPYHDCEWALRWWVLGFRHELIDMRSPELWSFSAEYEQYWGQETKHKWNAEKEVAKLMHSAGMGAALGAQRWEVE